MCFYISPVIKATFPDKFPNPAMLICYYKTFWRLSIATRPKASGPFGRMMASERAGACGCSVCAKCRFVDSENTRLPELDVLE